MTKKQAFAVLWFGVVAALLIRTTLLYVSQSDKGNQGEILLGHGLVMLVLAAPLGWPAVFVTGTVSGWLGVTVEGGWDAALISLVCGVAGYLQWFLLVPWLWRKWTARRRGPAAHP